jgi:hypothetical protein
MPWPPMLTRGDAVPHTNLFFIMWNFSSRF